MKKLIRLLLCVLISSPVYADGIFNGGSGGGGGSGTMGQVTIATSGGGANTGTCSSTTAINCTISTKLPIADTYTSSTNLLAADNGGQANLNAATAQTLTLTNFVTSNYAQLLNINTGVWTLTAGSGSINGCTSLAQNANATVQFDGTNWNVSCAVASSPAGANPSATAGPSANNGSATTFMRSDATPAIQKATNAIFGIVEVDNTTITASGGVISAVGGGSGNALFGTVTGNTANDFVSMSNTTVGVKDSGLAVPSVGTIAATIASGATAMGTGAISSAACATVVTATATNVATTDVVTASFNGDPTAVTGYVPLTTGMLTIIAYPTSGNVNFKVCNNTASPITPGAITLNWRVTR